MATRTAGGEGVDLAAMVNDESPADAVNIKLMRRRPPRETSGGRRAYRRLS